MKRKHLLTVIVVLVCWLVLIQQISASGQSGVTSQSGGPRILTLLGPVDAEMWETRDIQTSWIAYQEILQEANIDLQIEAIPTEQFATVVQTRVATDTDIPDLVRVNSLDTATKVNLGKSGMFLDVKPLVEQYSNGNIKSAQERYFPGFP